MVAEEAVQADHRGSGTFAAIGDPEAADLVFHLYVLLAARDLDVSQVEGELARRSR